MKIPKDIRKNIKSAKLTIKKGTIFPKKKMHELAEKTAEGMKKHHRMKHSKEDLQSAHDHMKKHGG